MNFIENVRTDIDFVNESVLGLYPCITGQLFGLGLRPYKIQLKQKLKPLIVF